MGERSRSFLKSRFDTGDHPNQSDFTDLIDSPLNWEDLGASVRTLVSAQTTAQARARLSLIGVSADTVLDDVGDVSATSAVSGNVIVYVNGSSEWGQFGTGSVGRTLIATDATADLAIGAASVGQEITKATSTAQFRGSIGIGDAGLDIVNASATSSVLSHLGFVIGPTIEVTVGVVTAKTTTIGFTPNHIFMRLEALASAGGYSTGQIFYDYKPGVGSLVGFTAYVSGDTFGLVATGGSPQFINPVGTSKGFSSGNGKFLATAYRI